jgi:hypothetical protein
MAFSGPFASGTTRWAGFRRNSHGMQTEFERAIFILLILDVLPRQIEFHAKLFEQYFSMLFALPTPTATTE